MVQISHLSCDQIVQHSWFNILLISASLNKSKEVMGENNDVEPTMLKILTPAIGNKYK